MSLKKIIKRKIAQVKIYWPYAIFGLFFVVVAVNFVYIIVAKDSWRGVATEKSYEKGVNYNKILDNIRKQQKLGFNIQIKINDLSPNRISLETMVIDSEGKNKTNLSVIHSFKHPVDQKYDFQIIAKRLNDYSNFAVAAFPIAGNWAIETAVSDSINIVQDVRNIKISEFANQPQPSSN